MSTKKKNIDNQQKEVDRNYEYFNANYNDIANKYPTKKYILMKDQKIVGGFNTWEDAQEAAKILYKGNETYSIQELNAQISNLGYQSYAVL